MGNLSEEKNKTSMKHGCLFNPIEEHFSLTRNIDFVLGANISNNPTYF